MVSIATVACAALFLFSGEATSLVLQNEEGPDLFTLHGREKFWVSKGSFEQGFSSVDLSALSFSASPPGEQQLELHIAFVPLGEFKHLTQTQAPLCSKSRNFLWGGPNSSLVSERVLINTFKTSSLRLKQPGPHMFVIVNCNVLGRILINGEITLKNPWGLLDTLDFAKAPFYVCAFVASLFSVMLYVFLLSQQDVDVRDTQYYAVLLTVTVLLESGVQCTSLFAKNVGWYSPEFLAETLYFTKVMYGITYMLQMSQGLGFTQHSLDDKTAAKTYAAVLVYVLASVPKVCLYTVGPRLAMVSSMDVMKVTLPTVLVSVALIAYMAFRIGSLLRQLRQRDDHEAIEACQRLSIVLVGVVVTAIVTLIGQIAVTTPPYASEDPWMHALWNDGMASVAFCMVAISMMRLSFQNYVGKALQMGALPTQEAGSDEELQILQKGQLSEEDGEGTFIMKGEPEANTIGNASVE